MKSSLDMGLLALEEGRYQQAIAILEATTKVAPDDPEVWLALARAYRGAGDIPKAIAAYQLILSMRPPEDLVAIVDPELEAIEHGAKEAIAEAMRPVCASCGAMLPASRASRPWCLCGWNTRTPPVMGRQLFLTDVFAYAQHRGVAIAFKRREDVFIAAKNQLRLQGLGNRTYPVDPRLALGSRERMAVVLQDELRPVQADAGPDGLFRERGLNQLQGGQFFSWRKFVARVSELDGTDVSMRTPDTSIANVLAAAGILTPAQVQEARKQRRPDETIGQALVRMGLVSVEGLVAGVVGEFRLGPQPVRPFAERLGGRLIAEGLLEARQLKQALFLQSQFKRPLGDLLIEARLAGPGDVQDVIERQLPHPAVLPQADSLGELLVASKLLSRTQLNHIEAESQRLGLAELEDFVRQRHLAPEDQVDRFVAWRLRKQELSHLGRERLGEILIAQRAITSETLGQALMQQVDDPRPLGQLLAEAGRITPEQLVAALDEQDRRRNRLAWQLEEESLIGTRPLDGGSSGPVAFARATTRALSRVLVGDDAPPPPPGRPRREEGPRRGRRKKRKRRATPWRLVAFAAVASFLVATAAGIWAGRTASQHPGAPATHSRNR
ncbi:MAG: tetratricopeptide repeat protein [Candidatus Sericytochromatia bacterium]|nr:tetratricopeptide repeat protein [Candidatus Tanganyikabacteria bacterium]